MFRPRKTDGGNVLPWEYLPAAAGTYQAGQLLKVENGKLTAVSAASTTTPPYLCQANISAQDGDMVPVTRVKHDAIYETTLSAAAADAVVGTKLQVAAGGLQANAAAAGSFEVVYLDGTAEGDTVLGCFA